MLLGLPNEDVPCAGEPTGYDQTDLIATIKHHKPDVLIGVPWPRQKLLLVCAMRDLIPCCDELGVSFLGSSDILGLESCSKSCRVQAVGRAPNCFNKDVVEAMLDVQREKPGGGSDLHLDLLHCCCTRTALFA